MKSIFNINIAVGKFIRLKLLPSSQIHKFRLNNKIAKGQMQLYSHFL